MSDLLSFLALIAIIAYPFITIIVAIESVTEWTHSYGQSDRRDSARAVLASPLWPLTAAYAAACIIRDALPNRKETA